MIISIFSKYEPILQLI